jgi:prolycopene isomerase
MWASYHYGGYHYIEGGSQAISNALAEVIQNNGGEILLNSLVTKIVIKDGKAAAVRTQDGQEFKCGYVVSNANAPDTLFKMVGREHLPADYLGKVDDLEIGVATFIVYMGVNHDYSKEFGVSHSISIDEVYDKGETFRHMSEGLPEKIGFVIVNYSMVDPNAAPDGSNVISFTTYMPYDWNEGWHEDKSYAEYTALKDEVAGILVKRAEEVLPGLGSHIEVMEVGSPRTNQHYTLNPRGAVYGWAVTPDRTKNGLPQETPIQNLFLAGAWTNAAGQNGVMRSGLTAAKTILEMKK